MPRARVIDRDPGRGGQAGVQNLRLFGDELLRAPGQKPDHLALGDHHSHPGQQRRQPLSRHLALDVERKDVPLKVGPEAAHQACRQSSTHRLS
jgi:hypothetical protein